MALGKTPPREHAPPQKRERVTGKDAHVDNPFSFQRVFERLAEWGREMPGIVRGLYEIARPFKRGLLIIFLFNVFIAVWETAQPLILRFAIAWIAPSTDYVTIALIIIIPILVIAAPHSIVLPFFRDLYSAWFFKPLLEKHIGMLALQAPQKQADLDQELLGKRAPIVQEGRAAVVGLLESLLREPAFAFRGLFVIGMLYTTSATLVAIVVVGMVLDLFITLLMDERLFRPYAFLREFQFRIRGLEYKVLDDSFTAEEKEAARAECIQEWDNYIEAARNAEKWRLIYQMPIRQTTSLVVRTMTMLIVASWVINGTAKISDYYWVVELAMRANDPLFVIFGIQQNVMTSRESLRRLGALCGIDFGIAPPQAHET